MPESAGRQSRKRLATRQRISDVASQLFVERGFDAVTIDEIAEAADVSRMTVFNHFPRKEDMFFDLDEAARAEVTHAVLHREQGITGVEALRRFAHEAVAEQRPYVGFFEHGSDRFLRTVQASEALKARARAIRDELTETLAVAFAQGPGRGRPQTASQLATTRLVAALLVATWEVALLEAHRSFQDGHDAAKANKTFLALIDRGSVAAEAVLEGAARCGL